MTNPAAFDKAFLSLHKKTGAGRDTRTKSRALHVEEQVCRDAFMALPAVNHELINTPAGVTRCLYCRETWAALDQALRRTA